MRYKSYTCRNHPKLRWSSKCIHSRHIFFHGRIKKPLEFYYDNSGVECDEWNNDDSRVLECSCPESELILAPEDAALKQFHIDKYGA